MSRASTDTLKFFDDPSVERFLELQQVVRESPAFDPYCRELLSIEGTVATSSPVVTLERLACIAETHQTCPRFHYVSARVHEILGELEEMRESVQRLQVCLKMIAETGDGDKESPFSVAFATDQADVLQAFGEAKRYQQTVVSGNRQFDVVTAHSGHEFWFNATRKPNASGESDAVGLVAEQPNAELF